MSELNRCLFLSQADTLYFRFRAKCIEKIQSAGNRLGNPLHNFDHRLKCRLINLIILHNMDRADWSLLALVVAGAFGCQTILSSNDDNL